MARNNSPESYQNFLDNFGSVDIFTGKPHAPYTGPTQEEFEAEERARLGDDLFFKYYPDAQRDDVSQPNTTGGLGGLGSIFDIIKNRMPAPPASDGGPILSQGPGKGRRQMPTGPISDNRMPSPTGPFEGGPAPLPPPLPTGPGKGRRQMPTGPFEGGPMPSRPQMPDPDMLQKLQEALRQKQNREMPQRTPPPMRGDMRKKGLLGGLIEKLEMQAAQKAEQPQMPTRPRTRGGMFRRAETLQNTQPYRGGRFGLDKFRDLNNRSTGGSGGILPRASGEPDLEQIRKQIMRGINVRGIGI